MSELIEVSAGLREDVSGMCRWIGDALEDVTV